MFDLDMIKFKSISLEQVKAAADALIPIIGYRKLTNSELVMIQREIDKRCVVVVTTSDRKRKFSRGSKEFIGYTMSLAKDGIDFKVSYE